MKYSLIFIVTLITTSVVAQTNTFPSSGNVGIGTTTPTAKLDLRGDLYMNAGEGFKIFGDVNYFGTWLDGIVFEMRDGNSSGGNTDGGFVFRGHTPTDDEYKDWMVIKSGGGGRVGIGTISPAVKLHVSAATSGDGILRLESDTDNNNEGDNPRIELLQDGGSSGAYLGFDKDWPSSWQSDNLFRIATRYSNNVITDAFVIRTDNGKVGIGTTNADEKLTVAGTVKSREVIVEEDTGADFVFEEDYDLPTLPEIEAFIQTNKHLPEIPTAEQMKAEGVKVGELQMKLLQKIEELTLYTIGQQKILAAQQKLIGKLQNRIEKLEKGED